MIRFCPYCGLSSDAWPDPMRLKRSPYCSDEHKLAAQNERKREKGKKVCPACGRGMAKTQIKFREEKKLIKRLRTVAERVAGREASEASGGH